MEATLENQPFGIERLKPGQRARHPLQLMSDWVIFTPAGQINPRALHTLRIIREHREELHRAMAGMAHNSS